MLRKNTQSNFKVLPILLCGIVFLLCGEEFSFGLPEVQEVVSGTAQISQPNSTTLQITADNNTIINYSSFNISENESVTINLPSADAQLLNRVLGDSASQLLGKLNSNGLFVLVNPSGIYIGPKATIDAGSVIMSTRDISNADFSNGNYLFQKLTPEQLNKLLLNEGTITIQKGGFGVLIAGGIENKGKIIAPTGTVALAAGDAVRLDIAKRGLISVAIEKETSSNVLDAQGNAVTDQIKNTGTLEANGGTVLLDAASISGIFLKGVNLAGYVNANKVENVNGVLRIVASQDVNINATVKATNIEVGSSSGKIPETVAISGGSLEAEKNITILAKKDITINADLTAQGIIHLEGQKIIDLTSAIKANTLKLTGQEFSISTNAVNLEVTKTLNDFVISKSSSLGDLITLEGDNIKLTYPITSNLTLQSDNPIRTTGTAIISAQKVSLLSNKFGNYDTPVRISADELVIHRLNGVIEIAQSTDQGGNISIRGPPVDGFGSIVYNKDTNLTLKATNGSISIVASVTLSANNLTLTASQGIYSQGSLLAVNTLTLLSTSDITSLGTIKAANLIEQGASFRIGGTYQVGYASIQNADNAINLDTGNYGTGSGNDPDGGGDSEIADVANIIINNNAVITLLGNLTLRADSDTNGTGAFTMNIGSSIIGGGWNLTLFASVASTLRSITGVGTLSINKSQGISNPTYTANNNISMNNFNLVSGTFNAGNTTLTLSGTNGTPFTNTGTFTASISLVIYTGNNGAGNTTVANVTYNSLTLNNAAETYVLAGNTILNGNLTILAGTLDVVNGQNYSLTVGGNWSNSGVFKPRTGTVFFNKVSNPDPAIGTQTLNSGGINAATQAFNSITHSGTGILQLLTNSLKVINFSQTAGTFDMNTLNMNVSGAFSLSASTTFTKGGTLTLDGAAGIILTDSNTTKQNLGNVTIGDGVTSKTVTLGSAIAVDTVTISLNGTLDASNSNYGITVSGNWVNSGTFAARFGTVTFNAGSEIIQTITSGGTNANTQAFRNLTHSGAGTLRLVTNSLRVGATFNNSGGTFDMNASSNLNLNVGGAFVLGAGTTFTKGGTLTLETATAAVITDSTAAKQDLGNVIFGDGLNTKSVTLGSAIAVTNLTISANGTLDASNSNYGITVSGNWTNSGTFIARNGTVTFTATALGKTIRSGGVGGSSFFNLTFNGIGGGWTLQDITTVSNVLTITAGGTLDAASNSLTLSGTTGTPFLNFGTFTSASSVKYTGNNVAGNTTVAAGNYSTLIINNSSETFVLGGDIAVSSLLITAGILDASSRTITLSGTTGTPFTNSGTFTASTSTVSYTGNNAGGNTTIANVTYKHLTLDNSSETYVLAADTTVSGNLTITAGTTLDASSKTLTLSGTSGTPFVNNGTFTASTSTVSYTGNNGLGNTTITAGTYYNLTLDNSSETYVLGDTTTVSNALTITAGTLDVVSHALTVGGNLSNSGTFMARSATVIFNGAVDTTQTLNIGSSSLNNLEHSGAGTLKLITNALSVARTFINFNGIFDANGIAATYIGLATVSGGTYQAKTALQIFNGGLTISGGTFAGAAGAVDVNGHLTLSSGTLTAPSGVFTVSGNWSRTGGTFTPGTGTVTFDGAGISTISGSTSFHNFTCTTAGKQLTFAATSTQIITGTLTLTGAAGAGNLIKLRSSVDRTQWKIDPRGTRAVSYVDVKDSNNVNSLVIAPTNSINSGNNINWFPAALNNETIHKATRFEVKIILNMQFVSNLPVIQQMKMDAPQSFQGIKMAEFKSTIKDFMMPTTSYIQMPGSSAVNPAPAIFQPKESMTPTTFQPAVQTMQEMKEFKTESIKEEGSALKEGKKEETK